MSIENLNRFLHELESDKELQEKINSIVEKCNPSGTITDNMTSSIREEIVKLAQDNGYNFSIKDMENYEKKQSESPEFRELSENELHAVAAGGKCACVMGGGGKSSESDDVCACYMAGGGNYADGNVRCLCTFGGGGVSGA